MIQNAIREAIDVYSFFIDRKKVHLVFQLWFITLLTGLFSVAFAAAGYETWDLLTFLLVWLAFFTLLEGLATLLTALVNIWIAGKEPARQMEHYPASHSAEVEWNAPALGTVFPVADGSLSQPSDADLVLFDFWEGIPGDEEMSDE